MTAADQAYGDYEDLTEKKDRGVLKKVLKEATSNEKPTKSNTCFVRYVGNYVGGADDGKEFDRSDKFDFELGTGNVIKAWEIGVASMKVGEVCELIVAPEYGYDDGKVMKFEIELFSFEGEDVSLKKDGSVRKVILEEGDSITYPSYGAEAKISYNKFSESADKMATLTYIVGDAESSGVPQSIDHALLKMKADELAKIEVKACGTGDAATSYRVKLHSFETIKRLSVYPTFEEQMKQADVLKELANKYLKAGKYFVALQTYKRLHSDLEYLVTDGVKQKEILDALKMTVHNNSALVYLKMNDSESAIAECNKVFTYDHNNEKAWFRMGQASLLVKDHDEAAKHFNRTLKINPGNVEAAKMKAFCDQQVNKAMEMERNRFRGIFNKLKDTGLGIPDDPEPMEEKSCDSCGVSSEDEAEPAKETA